MFDEVVHDLTRVEGVRGALLVSRDGLLVSVALPRGADKDLLGAMGAAIYGIGGRAAGLLQQGSFQQAMVEARLGKLLLLAVGDALLVVVTDADVNLGLIRLEMRWAADDIMHQLEGVSTGMRAVE